MVEEDKTAVVPTLRFPEFHNAPGWKTVPLEKIAERVSTKNTDGAVTRVLTNSAEYGVLDQRDYFDRDIASAGKIDGYYIVDAGDYVYNPRTSATAPVGPISRNNVGKGVMSPLYTVFRFAEEKTDFYEHFFKSAGWHSYVRKAASTGARHDRMSITTGAFMKMPVPTPKNAEQQKIADCLTSLNELIAAQGQKVEALKTYKRGLMRRLFPREGETVPRLRFPEFQDAQEWEEKNFGSIIEIVSGQVDPTKAPYIDLPHIGGESIESDTGKILEVETARELGLISGKYFFDETCILYSKIRPALNKVAAPNFKGICSADIYPVRPSSSDLLKSYLFHLLLSEGFMEYTTKHSDRSKIPKVNRETLLSYMVLLPRPVEQNKIALFLSSIDAQTAAEDNKLAALKVHKTALMQKLFPPSQEVK
ncbi:restriction endonuclease subunit S [Azotobacter chroococcum]|uniref:restriction endonuclease subunit S n=1 Tax=Azotobacter chroococcum TaxID=353 RepID=UPI000B6196A6|nr:restriction endonuclease subunit S [Azotobacter chroococcum]ASL25207.1 type I site-specific deoxyribonuclease [Azotobacter chroococcum]